MMKFEVGNELEAFPCCLADGEQTDLRRLAEGKPTMFLFLRFYGCRQSKVDLWRLTEGYGKIREAGGQAVVVLQSSQETMAADLAQKKFPFPVICDPEMKLYEHFSVRPAASEAEAASLQAVGKLRFAEQMGMVKGIKEGNPLQIPAAVLADAGGTIRFVRYGRHKADTPYVEEIVDLMRGCADKEG